MSRCSGASACTNFAKDLVAALRAFEVEAAHPRSPQTQSLNRRIRSGPRSATVTLSSGTASLVSIT